MTPRQGFERVSPTDIRLGEPLPYAVYDGSGMLLLQAGFVINTAKQRDVLIANGCFISNAAHPKPAHPPLPVASVSEEHSSFEMFDLLKLRLKRTFDLYKHGHLGDEFVPRIEGIALTIQEACTHDTDSALANLHLDYDSSYAVIHHLQAAMLCELIGKKLGVPDESRLPLIKAGLTHDIGLLDIQDTLDRQVEPLTPLQRERINRHPIDSETILAGLGVREKTWLDPVRHHHERLDGTGYPDGSAGEAISLPTRVLAIADIYSAMVRDRPYRKAMVSTEAMRKLMLEQGSATDSRLIGMMIKEIGVFPPGATVRLANGEIAVVKKRTTNTACPLVFSFVRADGMPMLTPVQRETAHEGCRIEGMVPFSSHRGSVVVLRGLWHRN
ncbi:HD-GYP domain-containing protein [Aromatoleum evansii]|uniref:HD domain-containing phosphohydrolase n=1 Tax=Aromatoleum evansii TaxID=59406 RepID=A0ABZ1AKU5_AROEV|nr:HD domain-containing phosphohydrolase [Aromatoleum evansii]NMG31686.1 HD domain-containing protein [Aromatoleum evansii]WRL46488.1 HD domain-containing phosphohydrolase [Aromatoleum evansii]